MDEAFLASAGLSLERLQTFARIVEASGFTAAAHGDPNGQSQFSRQLKELEEFFGAELVRRGHGRFALTAAGKALHKLVRFQFSALGGLRRTCASRPVELAFTAGLNRSWALMAFFPPSP